MPFFPSPLREDGYDIADYNSVHISYGDLEDFKKFLKSADERGIRVIIEMVLNHTSDQHAWFQQSRSSPDNPTVIDSFARVGRSHYPPLS